MNTKIKLLLTVSTLIFLFTTSCSQKNTFEYKAGNILYLNTSDSMGYSFAIKSSSLTHDTVKVGVKAMGVPTKVDRDVKVSVNEILTTAIEGDESNGGHFKLLDCVIPADSIYSYVEIVVYRRAEMKTTDFMVALNIESNENFNVNMGDRYSKFRMTINDKLTLPSNWNNYLKQYFGAPSLVKYQFIIDNLGIAIFPSYGVGSYTKGEMYFFKDKLMSKLIDYTSVNGDLIDEYGVVVSFN